MTLDFFGGRRLLLAGSRLGPFWMAALAVALILLVVLYREERRLVARRAGLFLLSLRLAAAAALVLALFEPIAARTIVETQKGRVLVAVDVSDSMTTTDLGRTAEQNEMLANALGLAAGEKPPELSRREVARRLIDGSRSPVARLAMEHSVEAVAFARETAPASLAALSESLKSPAKMGDPLSQQTNWEPALAKALELESGQAPVTGVVLLTDGRNNAPADPLPAVDRLAARGVPVYSVLIGSVVPPRDAAIAAIKAPESVYRGDVATIEATLKIDGYPGRDLAVTLDRPGASPLRKTVRAPASGEAAARPIVAFPVPLDQVGTVSLTVAVEPTEGDARHDNDRRTVSIQVVDDKARILLVDGEARWEFRYLRNALQRDSRVALRTVVFHQPPASGALVRSYETAIPARPDRSENKPDPLGAFDAIIVGDVGPADVSSDLWARLEAFVAERGGTLILSMGPRHWAALARHETARKLLPVVEPRLLLIDAKDADADHLALPSGAIVRPVAAGLEGNAWPMLQLDSDRDRNRSIWAGLPRIPWVVAGRVKPGATMLAAAAGDDSAAVMAAQPYGLGKILWVGTDGTWRWRFRTGDRFHHRFWGQVARWAASGRLAVGNPFVRFGPAQTRNQEGEPVHLQARISEGVASVDAELLVAARLFRTDPKTGAVAGEEVAVVPLRPLAGQPRTFAGDVRGLPAGSYVMRLDVPQLAETLRLDPASNPKVPEAAIEVVARETSERVELAAAREPLEHLASATGGRVLADFQAADLAPLLRARNKQTTRVEETALWDQPAYLLILFGILTAEWIARKRLGLP